MPSITHTEEASMGHHTVLVDVCSLKSLLSTCDSTHSTSAPPDIFVIYTCPRNFNKSVFFSVVISKPYLVCSLQPGEVTYEIMQHPLTVRYMSYKHLV